jgi:hypothetical protein
LGRELEYAFQTVSIGRIQAITPIPKKCRAPLERTNLLTFNDRLEVEQAMLFIRKQDS